MHQRVMQILERHEQEDRQAAHTLPWQDMMRQDFSNAEEVIALIQAHADAAGIQPQTMQALYHAMQVSGEHTAPVLVRSEKRLYIHRHTSNFHAYYHSHDFYELVYVHQGHCVQHTQAGPLPTRLAKYEACLLAPGAVHALEPAVAGDVVLKIDIPPAVALGVRQACPEACAALCRLLEQHNGIVTLQTDTSRFAAHLPALLEEHYFPKTYSEGAVTAQLALLATELARLCDKRRPASPLLATVAAHLRAGGLDTSLRDIAARLGYSADHLGRRIRRESGESFSSLRGRLKLDEAARLLRETTLPVEAVAAQLGYSSPSGFYKRFSAVYGVTPATYRRIHAV